MKFEWELVDGVLVKGTSRARVFGGWLVKEEWLDGDGNGVSIVFVPDPNHEWVIDDD